MQSLKLRPLLFYPPFSSISLQSFLLSFSTSSSSPKNQFSKETTSLFNFLNSSFKLSKTQSIFISKRLSRTSFPQNPLSVINFFKQIGFSQTQIQTIIRQRVQVLFSDVDKTLKPKLDLFQQLGFQGSDLTSFISKYPTVLTASLNRTLVPSVEAVKKIVGNENDLIKVLFKCGWILPNYQPFVSNIAFLESCGIVGDQVLILLKRQSRLLCLSQSAIRRFVLQAVELGFPQNSRMLIHGLHTISGLRKETFKRKLDLIQSFGFSKEEALLMFKKSPALFRVSDKKLKVGIEFLLHTVMLPKSALASRPMILMYSFEDRVFPRYRVVQLLKSQNLCKVSSFVSVLCLSEDMFLGKYILRFKENTEALLIAYKGHHIAGCKSWNMNTQEKIEAAGKKKEDGNALFQAGKHERSSKRYEKALKYIEYDSTFSDEEKQKTKSLKITCNLNNAACKLKLKDYKQTEKLCTKSRNVKALYRRAQAYIHLVNLDLAEMDIKKALEIDPDNRDVKIEYKRLKDKMREYNKKDAQFYGNIFVKMNKVEQASTAAAKQEPVAMTVDSKA